MGKKGKVGKNRQDKFYQLAKEQGFRSRAAFKLVQLNKRHDFLSSATRGVLDLCAAPGGWMQIARKHMPMSAPCVGIDLVPIRPVPGCVGLVGDITAETTRSDLRRALREAGNEEEKVDVVLNDGSPNMGKAWLQDAYSQSELTLAALKLSTEFLAAGGAFITKVFRSNDYNSLLFVMHQLFRRVNATKPTASRAESAEIYVMCLDFRAPKSIDPRMLNPKFVFKDMAALDIPKSEDTKPDLFLNTVMKDMKKQKRNRGGYADGDVTLFKKISILEFCETPRPVALMVDSSQFSFEPHFMKDLDISEDDSKRVAKLLELMPETTAEVLSCCEDLKVLARREFKLLLKWRNAARTELRKEALLDRETRNGNDEEDDAEDEVMGEEGDKGGNEDDEGPEEEEEDESSDPDEVLKEEISKARAEALAAEKRKKRKTNRMRNAIQKKVDLKIIIPDEDGDATANTRDSLFSLKTAKRLSSKGVALTDIPIDETNDLREDGYDADEEEKPIDGRLPNSLEDVDETWEKKNGEIEEDLNRWYKVYVSRKKKDKNGILLQESKERKRVTKRKALREALEKNADAEQDDGDGSKGPSLVVDSSESSDDGQGADDFHDGGKSAQTREAALWFSQPMFQGVMAISSDEESNAEMQDSENEVATKTHGDDDEDGENFHAAAQREAKKMAKEEERKRAEQGDGFDVVPQESLRKASDDDDEDGDKSDSSFHSSDYDTDEKAEMVAIGKRMRQSKREAGDVLDEAYNRYTFDDPTELPRWFADQDPVYRERHAPVTKEQVEEMKVYIKSLEAAPTKKEAEAKARRRARATKKIEEMKTKANNIAEQADVPVTSRMKAIEDLYKQAMKSGKGGKKNKKKVYQVVRPSGKMTVSKNVGKGRKALKGSRTTLVDRRLKSDKRGIEKAKRHAKGGKK